MKNLLAFLLSCLSLTAVIGQALNETRLHVLSKSYSETVLELTLTGADRHTVSTPAGEAFTVSFPEGTPLLLPGRPDLPKYATALMVPATGNMTVEVLASEYQDFPGVEVAPSKGNLKRNVDPDTIPYKYGETYQQDAFFPGQLADLQYPFILRDVRGQALWIYPVQYNPVKKVLRVYTTLTLRVYSAGGQGENEITAAADRSPSAAFDALYRKTFVNFIAGAAERSGLDPEKMLVIAKDELLGELEPLVAWKRQMGIHTTVVPVSAIGSNEASAIYSFVKDYYQANGITYLLLVGDEDAIRSEMRPSGGTPYSCDNCFGYMDGDDHLNEILVGRLHASTPEQLRIMVNRNLEYEKSPLADPAQNWCATGMAAASNEGQGIGDDNQADYEQANEWKTKHLADGYEKYWEFYDGSHAAISPTPGDVSADQPGNPVNTQLVDQMNGGGAGLYNYTGHGWEQGLSSGNFNVDAVGKLRNVHRYPILIAVACCAGNFTNGVCLGEAWQRAGDPATGEPWGGIAGFFSSDFQSWAPPMEGQDGMNQYLTDADGITLRPSIGGMLTYGNALMIAAYAQDGEVMADFWNPFAEPSTLPRTKLPQPLVVSHPSATVVGATGLSVYSVSEGALVSLYWQGQTLAVAVVENGVANLNFPPLADLGELLLTATQFNGIPYQSSIPVKPSGNAFVISQNITLDDASTGNNNQQADYGETVDLNLRLGNIGPLPAKATSATLSTADASVILLDPAEDFGDLEAAASVEKTAAFRLKVNDYVNDGHVVNFTLDIRFNDTQKVQILLPVKLNAPQMSISGFKIDDSASGNGDGYLQSGETARITVTNLNSGHSLVAGQGVLSTGSPWLDILTGPLPASVPGLNETRDVVFEVAVKSDAPQAVAADLHYVFQAGNYGTEADHGVFVINPVLETFESGNFGLFPWIMSGSKPWTISTLNPYSGQYCSRSGVISHNQKSVMELNLTVSAEGVISFARRVNCEAEFDFLRFFIDGEEMERWSGIVDWAEVSYPVSPGYHTFTWSYEKDDVVTAGNDRAWVDEISLPPHEIVVGTGNPGLSPLEVSLSPNPVTGKAWIHIDMPSEQQVGIRVFDCAGREALTWQSETRLPAEGYVQRLDLDHLMPGLYLVQIRTEKGGQKTLKMLKQ